MHKDIMNLHIILYNCKTTIDIEKETKFEGASNM